jgi:hypothetical protein
MAHRITSGVRSPVKIKIDRFLTQRRESGISDTAQVVGVRICGGRDQHSVKPLHIEGGLETIHSLHAVLGSQPFGSDLIYVVHHGEVDTWMVREVGGVYRTNEPGTEQGKTVHDHAPSPGPAT